MKKNKKALVVVLTVLAVILLAAAAGVLWLFSSTGMGSTEPSASAEAGSESAVVITDDDLSKLISGDLDLDNLVQGNGEVLFEQDDSAVSSVPEEADSTASSAPAASSSASSKGVAASSQSGSAKPSSTASSSKAESSSPKTEPAASASSSTAQSQPAGYEAEIKALLQQVYAVKARAESGLNSSIDSAKAEYWALPESQQTQARKIMIVLSKTGELNALQSSCDKEMESIVAQMRKVLQENGQSTALADQVMAAYNAEKSSRYTELKNKLYG